MWRRLPRRPARAIASAAALTAGVWLLTTFGDPAQSYAAPSTHRLDLAIAVAALALPLTTRLLAGRRVAPGPALTTWLAACAAAVPAEQLATLLVVSLDDRSPPSAPPSPVAGSDPLGVGVRTDPPSDLPWLWYPPTPVLAVLAIATTLLAATMLGKASGDS